jgi:hypothetical protein
MGSCSIPNSNPASGRISRPSLSRSNRLNSEVAEASGRTKTGFSDEGTRSCASLSCGVAGPPPSNSVGLQPLLYVTTAWPASTLQQLKAQRPTLDIQPSIERFRVGRSALDVERSPFSYAFRRVKGAWWSSRSSKPSLVGNGRDRFDSYPLRHFMGDRRRLMPALPINCQTSLEGGEGYGARADA